MVERGHHVLPLHHWAKRAFASSSGSIRTALCGQPGQFSELPIWL